MTKANSRLSTSKHSAPSSPKRLTVDELAAAIDAVHSSGAEKDDWPDSITATEYAAVKGLPNQMARSRLNRMVERGQMERKTVLRPNGIGKINRVFIYRIKPTKSK